MTTETDDIARPKRRMHYADGFGMPVCRKRWSAHTKNEPLATSNADKVRCLACRKLMTAARSRTP